MKDRRFSYLARRQRGQTLILFTMLFVVIIGFLALAIDLGFLFGQRRWDQDGTDASAMAAGRLIAGSVSPDNNNQPYIAMTDCTIYKTVRQLGGLSQITTSTCGSQLSSTPTGMNQNSGLDATNKVAVVLEYFTGKSGASWCFSPASISALPSGTFTSPHTSPRDGEGQCTLVTGVDGNFPPSPGYGAGAGPYKVRVTVSSVTPSSFVRMFSTNGNLGPSLYPTDSTAVACVRPGGAAGMLSCAQAVVSIAGVPGATSGAMVPFVAHDCNLLDISKNGSYNYGTFAALWTNNAPQACPNNSENLGGSWKAVIDLSWEQGWSVAGGKYTGWCPVYGYVDGMPHTTVPTGTYQQIYTAYNNSNPPPAGWPTNCLTTNPGIPKNANTAAIHDWQRDGTNGYQPDTSYYGKDDITSDVQYWASQGFGGTIIPDNGTTLTNGTIVPSGHGNYMPTYCGSGGCGGDQGQNIAAALYCSSASGAVSANGCTIAGNNQTTYFFAANQISSNCPVPGNTPTPSDIRCRMAAVPTWGTPQEWNSGANKWQSSSNQPDRVKIMEIVGMRLYCQLDNSGFCTKTPNDLGSFISGNSSAWGLFVSEQGVCTGTCNGTVSFTVNAATLSQ